MLVWEERDIFAVDIVLLQRTVFGVSGSWIVYIRLSLYSSWPDVANASRYNLDQECCTQVLGVMEFCKWSCRQAKPDKYTYELWVAAIQEERRLDVLSTLKAPVCHYDPPVTLYCALTAATRQSRIYRRSLIISDHDIACKAAEYVSVQFV